MSADVIHRRRWRGAVLPLVALLIWCAVSASGQVTSALFVTPGQLVAEASRLLASGELGLALAASLARNLTGFVLGTLAGVLVGIALGISPLWQRAIGPSLNTFKQISLFAWIPLLSAWFGLGEGSKVGFLTLAAFIPVVLNTSDGVRQVPNHYRDVGRVYQLNHWQAFRLILLPAAIPSIITGVYLSLMYTWMATIGAEYLLSSDIGITAILTTGSENTLMPMVLVAMIAIGLVGWLLNVSAGFIEQRLARRYGRR